MVKYNNIEYPYSRVKYILDMWSISNKGLKFRLTNSISNLENNFNIFSQKELSNKSFIIAFILWDLCKNDTDLNEHNLSWLGGLCHYSGCTWTYHFRLSEINLKVLRNALDKYYPYITFRVKYNKSNNIKSILTFDFDKDTNNLKFRKTLISLWKLEGKL